MKTQASFSELNQRIPLSGGDEHDWLTGWRRVLIRNHLSRQKVKRKYNRRWRKLTRLWAKGQKESIERPNKN